jgi:hypothetical protein
LSHGSPEQKNRGGERRRHDLGATAMEERKARVRVEGNGGRGGVLRR